ncbi:glycosyltransferase family 2 protein [Vibrio salilacus]|uniref:glycosyltransferase family 2 protein n=1 Tax=Vibrio salilacus TaxID=1323749 RepID=UPI000C2A07A5|nr:glycosyltransferase family A protein [Vibrio salilacus]
MDFKTEILLSTHEGRIWNVLDRVRKWSQVSNVLIVHQTNDTNLVRKVSQQISNIENVRYLNQQETGVSKSRNLALKHSSSRILLFCDDDVDLVNGFQDILIESFAKFPTASAVTYSVKDTDSNELTKNFSTKSFLHNRFTVLKVGTIEIAVRRDSVIRSTATFPENLGAGATLPVCDEPVFLSRLLDSKGMVRYIPIAIASHKKESSGTAIDSFNKLKSRSVCFQYIFGPFLGLLVFVFFSLKNFKKIQNYSWVVDCVFGRK